MFCKKSVLKNFVKLSVENQCRTRTQVLFCQFCKIFKNTFFTEHLRWLLFPILKPLDSQRQWCKWISELLTILLISTLLVLVGILCLFSASTSFPLHPDGFFNIRYIILFWQRRIEISWYLDPPIYFCANHYRNDHRITSILLCYESGDITSLSCHVTKCSMCRMTLWVGFPQPKSPPS